MSALLLGVEVGSGAVRAGLFDEFGRLWARGTQAIAAARPGAGAAEFRMDAVWHAVGEAIADCLSGGPELGMRVVGAGFAAAPALVLECVGEAPFADGRDVFGAADRRAAAEAAEIGDTGDDWLDRHGGRLAPGNSLARLLWLKRHAPGAWARLRTVRDLCDELARRATGVEAHSAAALATQWPVQPGQGGWRRALLDRLGLAGLPALGALDGPALAAGAPQGALLAPLAGLLGLPPGIPVAAGLPESVAGLLGVIGRGVAGRSEGSAVLVGGEAGVLLALSPVPCPGPGIAGPFPDLPFPGLHLHMVPQPWSGGALDDVLAWHPGGPQRAGAAEHRAAAEEILALLHREGPAFAARSHVVPDLPGASVHGPDLPALILLAGRAEGRRTCLEAYYAVARGLALGLRQTMADLDARGLAPTRVCLGGAQAGNPLMERLYRDAPGAGLVVSDTAEPVLLGAAMAASVATGMHPSLAVAVDRMAPPQARLAPDPFWRRAHDAARDIQLRLAAARDTAARDAEALAAMAR